MEAIKSGLGLTPKQPQEGTEPVSGESGKGTSAEPYDKGNAAGKLFFLSVSFFCYWANVLDRLKLSGIWCRAH